MTPSAQLRILSAQDARRRGQAARRAPAAVCAASPSSARSPTAPAARRTRAPSARCARSWPRACDAAPPLLVHRRHARDGARAAGANCKAMGVKRLVALRGDLPSGYGIGGEFQLRQRPGRLHPRRDRRRLPHRGGLLSRGASAGASPEADLQAFARQGARPAPTRRSRSISSTPTPTSASSTSARKLGVRHADRAGHHADHQLDAAACAFPTPAAPRSRAGSACGCRASATTPRRSRPSASTWSPTLCERLRAGGAPALHFYTMNQSARRWACCSDWVERMLAAQRWAGCCGGVACAAAGAVRRSLLGTRWRACARLRPLSRGIAVPPGARAALAGAARRYDLRCRRRRTGAGRRRAGRRRPREIFERGGASWYGIQFHQRKTANGERFDMSAMTAAHKTLPFNTRVCVRSLVNGREVLVRINDRGPLCAGPHHRPEPRGRRRRSGCIAAWASSRCALSVIAGKEPDAAAALQSVGERRRPQRAAGFERRRPRCRGPAPQRLAASCGSAACQRRLQRVRRVDQEHAAGRQARPPRFARDGGASILLDLTVSVACSHGLPAWWPASSAGAAGRAPRAAG